MSKYGFRLVIRFSGTPLNLFPRQLSRPSPGSKREHRSRNSFLRPNSTRKPSATSGMPRGKHYWRTEWAHARDPHRSLPEPVPTSYSPRPVFTANPAPHPPRLGWPRPPYCRDAVKQELARQETRQRAGRAAVTSREPGWTDSGSGSLTRNLKVRAREAARRRPVRGPGPDPLPHPRGLGAVHAGNCSPSGSALGPRWVPCHTWSSASGLHSPGRSLNSPQNPLRWS